VLDDLLGWRLAYVSLMVGLVVITVPLHWWGLDEPWEAGSSTRSEPHGLTMRAAGAVNRSRAFRCLMIANSLTALAIFAVVINLVPMLVELGMSRNLAALTLGLGGVGQVAGRLGYARFARSTTVPGRAVLVVAGVPAATAALALAPAIDGLLIAVGMLLGLARGIYTLVQATAVTDRWGPASYGAINGVLTAPALLASAVAPFAGATLADLFGSYADAFLVLAGTSAVAAVLMLWSVPSPAAP
jgi:MFS family permease